MAVPLQRTTSTPPEPDLARQVRELAQNMAALQKQADRLVEQLGIGSAAEAAGKLRELLRRLAGEPVEDGVNHPVQPLLRAYFAETSHLPWVEALGGERLPPALFADFLRIAGRVELKDGELADRLLEEGLASESVGVRDAATQAAEQWATPSAVGILRRHHEKVPWLADYIERVIRDVGRPGIDDRP